MTVFPAETASLTQEESNMAIFAEIVLFALFVFGVVDYIRVKAQNKLQAKKIEELTEQNEELRDLMLSDAPTLEIPPHLARKKILHG